MYGTETKKNATKIYIKKSLFHACRQVVVTLLPGYISRIVWHNVTVDTVRLQATHCQRVVWKLRRGDLVQFLSCLSLMFIIYCLFIFIACNYKRLSLRCASVDLKLFIAFIVSIMTTILSQSIDYFVKLIQLPIIFALAFLCFWMS